MGNNGCNPKEVVVIVIVVILVAIQQQLTHTWKG